METQMDVRCGAAHMQLIIKINRRGQAVECSAFKYFSFEVSLSVRQQTQSANCLGSHDAVAQNRNERDTPLILYLDRMLFAHVTKGMLHPRLKFRPFMAPVVFLNLHNPSGD